MPKTIREILKESGFAIVPEDHDDRPICPACKKRCEYAKLDIAFDAHGPMGTYITVKPPGHGDIVSDCCESKISINEYWLKKKGGCLVCGL